MNTPPITFTLIATCNGLTCSKVMTEPLTPSGNLLAELEDAADELAYRLRVAYDTREVGKALEPNVSIDNLSTVG